MLLLLSDWRLFCCLFMTSLVLLWLLKILMLLQAGSNTYDSAVNCGTEAEQDDLITSQKLCLWI